MDKVGMNKMIYEKKKINKYSTVETAPNLIEQSQKQRQHQHVTNKYSTTHFPNLLLPVKR